LGVIYVLIGAAALIAYFLRDILGLEIGIHGSLIPLSLLLVVGAGLLIVGRDDPEEKRQYSNARPASPSSLPNQKS
jgi:hypothetical protein